MSKRDGLRLADENAVDWVVKGLDFRNPARGQRHPDYTRAHVQVCRVDWASQGLVMRTYEGHMSVGWLAPAFRQMPLVCEMAQRAQQYWNGERTRGALSLLRRREIVQDEISM